MNEQQMSYFLEIYKCKNLRAASENLFITRQALSKSLASLEEELNCQLFTRGVSGLQPTETAALLKPHAEKIVSEFRKMRNEFTLNDLNANVLTVYAFDCIMTYISPGFIQSFRKENPDLLLNIVNATDSACEQALSSRDCDCAIVPDSINLSPFHATELITSHFCAVMGKNHHYADREYLTESDFDGAEMVGKGRSLLTYFQELNYILSKNIKPKILFETTEPDLLFHIVEKYDVIAYIWDFMICTYPGRDILLKPYRGERDGGKLYLAAADNMEKTAKFLKFREHLLKWIKENGLEDTAEGLKNILK